MIRHDSDAIIQSVLLGKPTKHHPFTPREENKAFTTMSINTSNTLKTIRSGPCLPMICVQVTDGDNFFFLIKTAAGLQCNHVHVCIINVRPPIVITDCSYTGVFQEKSKLRKKCYSQKKE